jgi:hypothetical protein
MSLCFYFYFLLSLFNPYPTSFFVSVNFVLLIFFSVSCLCLDSLFLQQSLSQLPSHCLCLRMSHLFLAVYMYFAHFVPIPCWLCLRLFLPPSLSLSRSLSLAGFFSLYLSGSVSSLCCFWMHGRTA